MSETATVERLTEHKVEDDSGWTIDRETGVLTEWTGIRILWRFEGERRWRKRVIVPDAEQEQTVASLKRDVDKIVAVLARIEVAPGV